MRAWLLILLFAALLPAQQKIVWSEQERPLREEIRHLRSVPDSERAAVTQKLAAEIRRLPAAPNRLALANALANLATEGDFGHDTLAAVADTLAAALHDTPPPSPPDGGIPFEITELATLVRYEHVAAKVDDPRFQAAMNRLAADDETRAHAAFTLTGLDGRQWTLAELRGKVVLVNFWATWCPPCRKEMPDLQSLYDRFRGQGLVVLAISDEEEGKVRPYIAAARYTFPVLLDPGRKVSEALRIEGIPKSLVFDRSGKLVAQSIDMRTQKQFVAMLAAAGLR